MYSTSSSSCWFKTLKKSSDRIQESFDCSTTNIILSFIYTVRIFDCYCPLRWLAKEHSTLNQLLSSKRLPCLRKAFVNCATTTLGIGPLASATIPPVYDAWQRYAASVDRKSARSADWPSRRCVQSTECFVYSLRQLSILLWLWT